MYQTFVLFGSLNSIKRNILHWLPWLLACIFVVLDIFIILRHSKDIYSWKICNFCPKLRRPSCIFVDNEGAAHLTYLCIFILHLQEAFLVHFFLKFQNLMVLHVDFACAISKKTLYFSNVSYLVLALLNV